MIACVEDINIDSKDLGEENKKYSDFSISY
jgi:hypothetical protein